MNSYRKQTIWQGSILLFFTVMVLVIGPTYVTAAVRFVVTGDSRGDKYDDDGVNQNTLREMARYIDDYEDADFILFTGDLVYGRPPQENQDMAPFKKQLEDWKKIMDEELSVPVYPVRGNHDANAKDALQAWQDVFDLPDNGPEDEKEITYSFTQENVFIVGLDQYGDPKHTINQDWLNQQFDNNCQPHVFVFGHAPAFSVRLRNGDSLDDHPDERNDFWNSFACEGGRIYFAGHDHFYNHARIADGDGNPDNDLHQFVVGTAGAPLWEWDGNYNGSNFPWKPKKVFHEELSPNEEFGYVVVEIDGQNVTATWKHRTVNYDNSVSYVDGDDDFSYNLATTTACFQDGVCPSAGYSGTRDTTLSEADPNANFGNDINLYVDGDDPPPSGKDLSALLYWDISTIPPSKSILGACITTNVSNKTNNAYGFYKILKDWDENEATWNRSSNSFPWGTPGARGPEDRDWTPLGSFSPSEIETYTIGLNDDGVASVQSWVDDPSSNHGLIIDNGSASDGADFDSSEASTQSDRPKLTVLYTDKDETVSLSYTPVTPCRIVDTRKAGGAIPPGGVHSYNVRGNVAFQGGTASCPSPKGEPRAVHINVTAVPLSNGWITAYPYCSNPPIASLVNYRSDAQNVANSGTIKTCVNCPKDINIKSGGGTAHVVIDVLGYYYSKP